MTGLVAVTGATGFLGRYIVRSLIQQGWRVRILARNYPVHEQFSDLSLEVVPGDLSDQGALGSLVRGADRVVHAAGLIKARDARAFHQVNVAGTANLVAALNGEMAASRLLLISSMAAREPHLSPYAGTKRAAEEIVRTSIAPRHHWTILRPAAVYGPWDMETLTLMQAVSLGVSLRPGNPGARVSLVHARDVAEAVAALCASAAAGGLYEISDARHDGYSWEEITGTAAKIMGARTLNLPLAGWAVHLAGAIGSIGGRIRSSPAMLTIAKAREIMHPDWSSPADRQPPKQLWQPKIGINCGFRETIQ
ncbi:MAG: SDR family NAD(P)-dependent oxidoreductase, partial [Alphaproteobacteria bacterium]